MKLNHEFFNFQNFFSWNWNVTPIFYFRITLPTNLLMTPKPLLRTWTFSEWSVYGLMKRAKDSPSDIIISDLTKPFMNHRGNFSAMKCFGCLYMRFYLWIPYGGNVGYWICPHFVKADLEVPLKNIFTFANIEWTKRPDYFIGFPNQKFLCVPNGSRLIYLTCDWNLLGITQ